MASDPKSIIIIGGGIIGSTTAYFLTRHPSYNPALHKITLLEATKIAGGASGKAGGLLALWAYPSAIVPLSYRLHEQLAKEHGGAERWGYRKVHCGQLMCRGRAIESGTTRNGNGARKTGESDAAHVSLGKRDPKALAQLRAAGVPDDLDWTLPENTLAYDEMGTPSTTAQVHPFQFTTSMAALAEERGAEIVLGSVEEILYTDASQKEVKGVRYRPKDASSGSTEELEASHVILTTGPWTKSVYPKAPISALRAHSVTIRPTRPVSAYALFTQIQIPSSKSGKRGQTVTPEIYARPNQEVYACGEGDTMIPLPPTSDEVVVDQTRCQDIVEYVSSISDELRDGEVTARQACYLPQVQSRRSSGPLIGETGVKGLSMASGHTCWGIQNGPGTGMCMSELIMDGKVKSANLAGLEPWRALL